MLRPTRSRRIVTGLSAMICERVRKPFFSVGSMVTRKSGKTHTREAVVGAARREVDIALPLRDLRIRLLDENTAQITYISETGSGEDRLLALRSSIWSKTSRGWQLRFHQGTPIPP